MNKRFQEMIAGYVDGELTEAERSEFERELAVSSQLQIELEEFRKLKEVTSIMRYADLPLEVWEDYWQSLYRKLERGIGWIFMSIGAMLLLGFGAWEVFSQIFTDPTSPWYVKVGLPILLLGLVILVVSMGRERLFAYRRDRYKEVIR